MIDAPEGQITTVILPQLLYRIELWFKLLLYRIILDLWLRSSLYRIALWSKLLLYMTEQLRFQLVIVTSYLGLSSAASLVQSLAEVVELLLQSLG